MIVVGADAGGAAEGVGQNWAGARPRSGSKYPVAASIEASTVAVNSIF